MNLHEYQAKQLFARYQLPVPQGIVCTSAEQTIPATQQLGAAPWVIKCQVHAGGRGKAGGVKLIHNQQEAFNFATQWLGQYIVTPQTQASGQPVHKVYIEKVTPLVQELYLSAILDRNSQRIVFMASTKGGMNIEDVAAETPNHIFKTVLDPLTGAQPFQGRQLAYQLGLQGRQVQQLTHIFLQLSQLMMDKDLSLVEINPLAITENGDLLCLDAKITVDNNALFRQTELKEMYDITQENPLEAYAAKRKLSYIALDGNIGCLVNGAGLAMATMDMVKLYGGSPANFLDVGGSATKENVTEAFKIILSDKKVTAIFVNIFGGIVRCDLIAEGIIAAVTEVGINIPVIVRLEGNRAEYGAKLLEKSQLNIISILDLSEATKRIVAAAENP